MNNHSIIGLLVLAIGVFLAFWLWPHAQEKMIPSIPTRMTSTPLPIVTTSPQAPQIPLINIPDIPGHPLTDQDKQNISKIERMVHAPISFWGEVIDQNKQPVPDANVHYSAANHYFASGDKYQGTSDGNGLFSLTGVEGMALFVEVSKDGYYQEGAKSMYSIAQAQMPTQDHPAIFELRKRGQAERLIVKGISGKFIKEGVPVQVDLTQGRTFNVINGDIQVQAWINNSNIPRDSNQRYDWRCVITIPNGGLQPRMSQFDFEAPESGYHPTDEIIMPANADRWRDLANKSYFVQLGNGDYARIDFSISTGIDTHSFTITSYLNPTPGHRNLEYAPPSQTGQ